MLRHHLSNVGGQVQPLGRELRSSTWCGGVAKNKKLILNKIVTSVFQGFLPAAPGLFLRWILILALTDAQVCATQIPP